MAGETLPLADRPRIAACVDAMGWTGTQTRAWLHQHFQVARFADLPAEALEPAISALVAEVATWARPSADEEWAEMLPITDPNAPCTEAQRTAIAAARDALAMNPYHFKNFLLQKARVDRLPALTVAQAEYVLSELTKRVDRPPPGA